MTYLQALFLKSKISKSFSKKIVNFITTYITENWCEIQVVTLPGCSTNYKTILASATSQVQVLTHFVLDLALMPLSLEITVFLLHGTLAAKQACWLPPIIIH